MVKLKTLTFKEYTYSSNEDRDWILWSRGVKIAERSDGIFYFTLYQVDGFYIELQYNIVLAVIIETSGFDNLELLDPYLQQLVINVNY